MKTTSLGEGLLYFCSMPAAVLGGSWTLWQKYTALEISREPSTVAFLTALSNASLHGAYRHCVLSIHMPQLLGWVLLRVMASQVRFATSPGLRLLLRSALHALR